MVFQAYIKIEIDINYNNSLFINIQKHIGNVAFGYTHIKFYL
ncbi:hypothetical protein MWMV8_MWMV8_00727 [Acinetobacter calcoaceticus]|jgi:hypothetical protein|nr:hypothetical protein MWMV8_MWMV8_00727 [Acinetobacter calcoaceticus]